MSESAVHSLSARGARAHELASSTLQDHADGVLDRLVADAATLLDVAGVNVSVLSDRQVTVAGLTPDGAAADRGLEIDFEDSICANALRTDEPRVIPDTRADARVSSIPAVADGPVRSYLGSAIRTDEGVVAVLCVYDVEPRAWNEQDIATLARLADDVRSELLRAARSAS
jgi:GAF domain-containing protein